MSEDLKALNKKFYEEVMNGRNLDLLDEMVAEDMVEHQELPGAPPGREGVKYFMNMMFAAFPDATVTMEDEVVEDNKVWSHARIRGTHKGDFMGIPATGKSVDFESIDIVRVKDGMAVEHWGVTDMAGLMMQLGVLEGPPS